MTGKKMVYALWVAREDFARKYPERVKFVLDTILESKDYAHKNINEIANFLGKEKNIDCAFMKEYLHTLNYDLDSESKESLELYFRYAMECGIINSVKLRFFESSGHRQ